MKKTSERQVEGQAVRVQTEDNAHVLLDFGSGTLAVITAGFTMQQYRCPAVELYGSEGTLQMMGDDWDPEGYELFLNKTGVWEIHKETDPGWLWSDGLRHAVDCIQRGVSPQVTPEHAYHTLEVLIRAKESAQEGRVMDIDSTFPAPVFDVPTEPQQVQLVHDRTHQR